jgi:hypothetical protein
MALKMPRISTCCLPLLLVIIVWFAATTSTAHAEKRVALVIGNSSYVRVPTLSNPENDARAIAKALSRLGFDVSLRENLGKAMMEAELADFSDKAAEADLALVYYAGHGIEMNGENYLIPVDARLKSDNRIQFETVSLENVMAAIDGAKALKLVLLDACRDNPFANTMKRSTASRSVGRGLAKVETKAGVLVSYAAAAGTTAADGEGKHSPYTEALLSHIEQPGLELSLLFRKVADDVQTKTNGRQTPFEYGRLPGSSIYLKEPDAIVAKEEIKPATVEIDQCRDAAAHWGAIQAERNPALFEDHLKRFSQCAFSTLAEARLETLAEIKEERPATKPVLETAALEQTVEETPLVDVQVEKPVEPVAETTTTSVGEEDPAKAAAEIATLTRGLQDELRRTGCSAAKADGIWGPQSQKALQRFGDAANKTVEAALPSQAALDLVRATTGRVCTPICGVRQVLKEGECIAKTCTTGLILSKKGECIEVKQKPKQREAIREKIVRNQNTQQEVTQTRRRPAVAVVEEARPVRRREPRAFNRSRDDCMTAFMCDN